MKMERLGLVEKAAPPKPFGEMLDQEKDDFYTESKAEIDSIKKGHQRILDKQKEIRQNFSKAIVMGS